MLGLAGFGLLIAPAWVERDLGPASPQLGSVQRILLAWQLLPEREDLLTPMEPGAADQDFSIQMGETANSVAAHLQEVGLVRGSDSFRNYLVYAGLDTSIQAGKYRLSAGMKPVEIARALQDATPKEVEFNILPGWRLEEIAQALPTSGLSIAPADFIQIVQSPPAGTLPAGLEREGSLEGYLLPGAYQVPRETTARDLLRMFLERFNQETQGDILSALQARGLDLEQAVTLASIVQREAILPEEQPLIASVFLNRLDAGMKLESDPTVQYALGYNQSRQTWWTNPLSTQDLAIESPYNTYQNSGLPPGPICNPSLGALKAVAYPAQTPYFYFRAACDKSGRHNFAKTYEEHIQNGCP